MVGREASTWEGRWRRRAISVPLTFVMTVLWLGLLPLSLPVALLLDLVRWRPLAHARFVVFLAWFLVLESLGVLGATGTWLIRAGWRVPATERFLALNFRLQRWWAGSLWRAVRSVYGVRMEVTGDEDLGRRPFILLVRHVSTADTILPANFVASVHGVRLRYVIKEELTWDPCLDIVGHRLPNHFVRRGSEDPEAELAAIRTLAEGMGPGEGALIFPEGTRFTKKKRARIIEKAREAGDQGVRSRAESLHHVLLPRTGGLRALMEGAPEADLVILSHVGFEGVISIPALLAGALVNRKARMRLERFDRGEVPDDSAAFEAWLHERWLEVDAWVGAQLEGVSSSSPQAAAHEDQSRDRSADVSRVHGR